METDYARRYRDLYERHWWWRARERWILDALHRHRPTDGWRSILDIGCGDGLFFEHLADLGEVEGVEADAALVSTDAVPRGRIHVAPFDANFRPGKLYSLILMLDVLEHLQDPVGALRHAMTLLEPGGTVLVTVPAFMLLWTNHDVLNHHMTRYTARRMVMVMNEVGLDVRTRRYFFHWTCPAKVVLRIVEAVRHRQPSPPRVPASWINRSLYLLSRAEQRMLSGLPVPFGSSLLVIAEKPRSSPSRVTSGAR